MEFVESFLSGKPSVYDIGSFVTLLLLLCVVLGIHRKQISNGRKMAEMESEIERLKLDRVGLVHIFDMQTQMADTLSDLAFDVDQKLLNR